MGRVLPLVLLCWLAPASAGGFALIGNDGLVAAARWSAEDYRGTGLQDGLSVAVMPGFAEELGALPEEVELVRDAVRGAVAAWESPVLSFAVAFDGPANPGVPFGSPTPGDGLEIDVFAVPAGAWPFAGSRMDVAGTWVGREFVGDRLLTSGQRLAGNVMVGADIYVNIDAAQATAAALGLDRAEQIQALQRVLTRQVGVALGLNSSLVQPNIDADDDPTNPMPVEPCVFFAGLAYRAGFDALAVMNGESSDVTGTALRPDDVAGRDVLYPAPPAGGCGPLPAIPGPELILDAAGLGPEAPLTEPSDLAVAPDGTLFVAGQVSRNVFRRDPGGSIAEIAGPPEHDIGAPLSIALSDDGLLWVGASHLSSIDTQGRVRRERNQSLFELAAGPGLSVYGISSNSLWRFSRNPPFALPIFEGLPTPGVNALRGLAVDAEERLFFGAIGGSVHRRDPDDSVTLLVGPEGDGETPLADVGDVEIDPAGNVYVSGTGIGNVFRIAPDGSITEYLAASGDGLGGRLLAPIQRPFDLALDAMGNLYAAAQGSGNVLRRSPDGEVVELIGGLLGAFGGLSAIAVDPLGSLYAASKATHRVVRLPAECRPDIDVAPRLDAVSPPRVRWGQLLAIAGGDFAPGFGVFLGGTRLEADLFAPGVISARIPELPAGLYPVRVVNPPVCATLAPLEIEVMPGPSPCGAGGSGAAWLAPAIVLGARARRRRARMLRSA